MHMKSKTLIGIAVASTIGWSAASYAGPSHQVVTPFSPNESGENIFSYQQGFSSQPSGAQSERSRAAVTGSSIGPMSDSSTFSSSSGETASFGNDSGSLAAADQGIYSDYYVVSWTAVPTDTWDYYVIDDGGSTQLVAVSDYDVWLPTHELALVPSSSDEMIYELVLIPMTLDDMSASLLDGSGEAFGE